MMSKEEEQQALRAQEKALKYYPVCWDMWHEEDLNAEARIGFKYGYIQAENECVDAIRKKIEKAIEDGKYFSDVPFSEIQKTQFYQHLIETINKLKG